MSDLDVILIGAGHNPLTCAAYLGMAGLRVRVLERRSVVGGACVTEEFHPGFRNSTAAYSVENEADLVGERRAAAGAVGGSWDLCSLIRKPAPPSSSYPRRRGSK